MRFGRGPTKPMPPARPRPAMGGDMGAGKVMPLASVRQPVGAPAQNVPSDFGNALQAMQKTLTGTPMKKGGQVKSSASKRADGCATKGKTRGKMV